MSQQLKDALSQAEHAGRVEFATRDADDVIVPATRRVRRQRAMVATGSALGVAVIAGGIVWGAEAYGPAGPGTVDPAGSANPSGTANTEVPEVPWSTLQLAAIAEPRKQGELREDSVAGMICNHDSPTDDPRVYVREAHNDTISHALFFTDCAPVWFKHGPATTDSEAFVSMGDSLELASQATIHNVSANSIAIDRDSIFMWVESAPAKASDGSADTYAGAVIGTSMWDTSGYVTALLDSSTATTVIEPGEALVAAEAAAGVPGGSAALSNLLKNGQPFTVTFWARVHEENPSGDATYLIQLGAAHEYLQAGN
ncbi:hypothetical protein [Demequina sp.]|uniref:hypothetical protein n=1 Tax=Demequina sp. TaxID=2050685 RepID=UPI003D0EF8D4